MDHSLKYGILKKCMVMWLMLFTAPKKGKRFSHFLIIPPKEELMTDNFMVLLWQL